MIEVVERIAEERGAGAMKEGEVAMGTISVRIRHQIHRSSLGPGGNRPKLRRASPDSSRDKIKVVMLEMGSIMVLLQKISWCGGQLITDQYWQPK